MKPPTSASLKKVTPQNLASLGVERLAEILASAANARPELKRRLRMELAAQQGAEQLAVEIDRRLDRLETSRSKVSWRQRQSFIRDLDGLRQLIASRLAELDSAAALQRMWLFMEIAQRVRGRVRDRDGALAAVFRQAADDLGALVAAGNSTDAAAALVEAIARDPADWADWLPAVLTASPPALAAVALRQMAARDAMVPGALGLLRLLADAAGDVDAYRATYPPKALLNPANAAEVGRRLLASGRVDEAGVVLQAAGPDPAAKPDFEWETAWIDYLDRSGQADVAQAVRWTSFKRVLSAERARAYTRRLKDFEDVEAEGEAFFYAHAHPDVDRALQFLFDWPALPEAARLILARSDQLHIDPERASQWAAKLAARYPAAANALLRKAAAIAFRRRDFAASDRLTQEADNLAL
jgi:hypothetical protein